MIKKLLINIWSAAILLCIFAFFHIMIVIIELHSIACPTKPNIQALLTVDSNVFLPFSRFGALLTLFGAALSARRIIRLGWKKYIEHERTTDGGEIPPPADRTVTENELNKDIVAMRIGNSLLFFGAIIWGYGDIFFHKIFILVMSMIY